MPQTDIIARARRYIAKSPPAISGQGGHNATFHIAALLVHGFGLGDDAALPLLREFNQRCLPPWSEPDLVHKIKSAASAVHLLPRGHLLGEASSSCPGPLRPPAAAVLRPKPKFQKAALTRVAKQAASITDPVHFLAERSPVDVARQDSASVLRHLYERGTGEKVLIFTELQSQGQFLWQADQTDRIQHPYLPAGNDGVWFLPQPVCGRYLPNPRAGGKMSRRSAEAVVSWRYAVLESDEAEPAEWLRCLVQMPLRITSICESGKRSIHALVRVDAASKADWDKLMGPIKPVLITLGADPGALTAIRLTRLPQAMRGERRQRLLYLNPQPNGEPIMEPPAQSAHYSQNAGGKGHKA
jgi:hypothetical protein